jgi:hypothetical protein
MELVFLAFIVLLNLAATFGWTADSREGRDWAPTANGARAARWQ